MTILVITRGLPASGKTTWARQWQDEGERRARVNRDDLRLALFGRPVLTSDQENTITKVQQETVRQLLRTGHDVVVDDTNLRSRFARAWADLADQLRCEFQVRDFTDVPLATCLERDAARGAAGGREVSAEVIEGMYRRYLAAGRLAPVRPGTQPPGGGTAGASTHVYRPDESKPPAWLVDLDGTLALMNGRGPFEWHRVGEDAPNQPVVDLVRRLHADGVSILVVSGRDGSCEELCRRWLVQHQVPFDDILMRKAGDNRRDSIVKREIFDNSIRDAWWVQGVLDDRNQVVDMWRDLGLLCAQVAPGDF
jgi:predicted kinase